MANLWSGRFEGDPDPDVFEFGASFKFDCRLFEDDVRGSMAWTEALKDAGVLTTEEAQALLEALAAILTEGTTQPLPSSGPDEDVHSFVERRLIERIGEVGKRLHTGRSRNDQVALDFRLYVRRRIPLLLQRLVDLVRVMVGQAESAGEAVMPAYTHLRRAQPILVAHYWLSHIAALQRDHGRLEQVRADADALPLGSGALAGTPYPVDTAALAARLGFSRVAPNSLDAVADRDFVATFLHTSALAMVHLSRLAEDLILFTSEEFGFFDLADDVATGSSLMPQKKNPDALELVRGKAGRVIGRLAGWLTTMKGLPAGYNKDLQEDKEALFEAEDTLSACLRATTAVVGTLDLNAARTTREAGGFMLATDVADYLVAKGLPFRRAHEVVAGVVRRLVAEQRDFTSLTRSEWQQFSDLFQDDMARVITPQMSVRAKRTPQSTHPDWVAEALRRAKTWVDADHQPR